MPQRDVGLLLQDVLDACHLIIQCVEGKTLEAYSSDLIIRAAVERQFEIIGEAIRRMMDVEPSLSLRIAEAREIIAFRNILAHGYHLIDHGVVWKIACSDVPLLRAKADELIRERAAS